MAGRNMGYTGGRPPHGDVNHEHGLSHALAAGHGGAVGDSALQNEMRVRIKKYFHQITRGCGDPMCGSPYCASNEATEARNLSAAAVMAVELARSGDSNLCTARLHLKPLQELLEQAQAKGDYSGVGLVVSLIFSSPASLCRSFVVDVPHPDDTSGITVDADMLRQAMELLGTVCAQEPSVQESLHTALTKYISVVEDMSTSELQQMCEANSSSLNHFVVVLELQLLIDPEFHETLLSGLVRRLATLPQVAKRRLTMHWGRRPAGSIRHLVAVFQQFITMRLLHQQAAIADYVPNKDQRIIDAVQCLAILYEANEYTRRPVVSPKEFYNDAINEHIDLRTDFPLWTTGSGFSFCQYPFILNPAVKSEVLKVENIVNMRHEMQGAFFRAIFAGPQDPYLMLRIRREHLIRDALTQLSSKLKLDLKKQLRVQFIGEEGVDEGGVQKEFFQLVVREIFDPKYGMFVYNEETRLYWINPDSRHLGNEAEFELIGQILGLAIYNSVILDVHFPIVIYSKLMSRPVDLDDLLESHPQLGRGLQQLREFEGDVEEVYQRTFQIEVDSFEMKSVVDLKPSGSTIVLNNNNRKEYIDLYVNWVLNKSIEEQFRAFKRGFDNVACSNALKLFTPEEVELLVCGSPDLDFHALEQSTMYDGGFTKDSPVVRHFWSIVHDFTEEQKKKLLFFATGSDRVPIGGLSKLNFVIAKNGPDSDRLPTAHTCFNVLLLCEYATKEKLRERLLTAIQNAEGFGLI